MDCARQLDPTRRNFHLDAVELSLDRAAPQPTLVVAFRRDALLTGSTDGPIRSWDLTTRVEREPPLSRAGFTFHIAIGPAALVAVLNASLGVGEDDRAWTYSAAIARTATGVAATGMRQR